MDVEMERQVVAGGEDARDAVVLGRVDGGDAQRLVEQEGVGHGA